MPDPNGHLERVGELSMALRELGLEPILVGGMALVVLGSRRVTRDFDFVISHPRDWLKAPGRRAARTLDTRSSDQRYEPCFTFPASSMGLSVRISSGAE